MSGEEKNNNPTYKTTGGYLKVIDYKDAHRIWWKELSKEDKEKITSLPNFDANQFEFITGIKVNDSGDNNKLNLVKSKIVQLEDELAKLKAELNK